jgi:molybdopterin-biosynthesis enzyme MoeA-like protein
MIGGIIIGDEIMRGKREDKHFRKLIELLAARGLKLDWAQYLGDSPALITETLRRSLATPDIVFCFGGIGATPDDHTRQCAAAAVGWIWRCMPRRRRRSAPASVTRPRRSG